MLPVELFEKLMEIVMQFKMCNSNPDYQQWATMVT